MSPDELNHAALQRLHAATGRYKPAGTALSGLPRYLAPNRQHWTFDPVNRDADAFTLQVALCMKVQVWESTSESSATFADATYFEMHKNHANPAAATRYAITRAAAKYTPED